MQKDALNIDLKLIESSDKLTGLSLGDKELLPLKTFIQKKAKKYQANSIARTYGLFDSNEKIIGYITLVCSEVVVDNKENNICVDNKLPKLTSYPAIKIARLAIDRRYQGKGLGNYMVSFSIALAKDMVMPHVGCRFVVVDSKKTAVNFYERLGFTLLDTEYNKSKNEPVLFLDILKA